MAPQERCSPSKLGSYRMAPPEHGSPGRAGLLQARHPSPGEIPAPPVGAHPEGTCCAAQLRCANGASGTPFAQRAGLLQARHPSPGEIPAPSVGAQLRCANGASGTPFARQSRAPTGASSLARGDSCPSCRSAAPLREWRLRNMVRPASWAPTEGRLRSTIRPAKPGSYATASARNRRSASCVAAWSMISEKRRVGMVIAPTPMASSAR